MVEPQNYVQSIINRVADIGAKQGAKTLIVSSEPALKHMVQQVAYLELHDHVEFLEATKKVKGFMTARMPPVKQVLGSPTNSQAFRTTV